MFRTSAPPKAPRTPQARRSRARSEAKPSEVKTRGFTLLEVLAAAVIMLMFYGVLTAKGVEGFAMEGDADRRLRASLVADRRLADLESLVAQGLPPELGSQEDEEEGYLVRVDVGPVELPLAALLPEDEAERLGRRGAPPSLLAPPATSGQAVPLRTVQVTVSWDDGIAERSVKRTTFALDPAAAAEILAAGGVDVGEGGGLGGLPSGGDSGAGGSLGGVPTPNAPATQPNTGRNRRIFRQTEDE